MSRTSIIGIAGISPLTFVHREFLRTYLTKHVMPFTEVLATRMIDYQRKPKAHATRPKELSWDAFMKSLP